MEQSSDLKPQLREKTQFVMDIQEGQWVKTPFLVKMSLVTVDKNGRPYMQLVLMDKSGEVEARIWDDVARYAGQAVQDSFVWIEAQCKVYQSRKQLVIRNLQMVREDEIQLQDYLKELPLNVDLLYSKIVDAIRSMKDPDYRALAEVTLLEDPEIVQRLKRAPAAKTYHHAYPCGLLEHMVSITELLDRVAEHYQPHVDRDLLFLGGFFHDIGKLWELSYDRVVDYTTEGRLVGHLVMGVELVTRKIHVLESQAGRLSQPQFPELKKILIKHVILSHHGLLEYGSPKRPKCLEAFIVHAIDDLDSKVNAVRKFIEADMSPGPWTQLNRQFERYFFKNAQNISES